MTMRERMARAIDPGAWASRTLLGGSVKDAMQRQRHAFRDADNVLDAMREPDEATMGAMESARSGLFCCPEDVGLYSPLEQWQAMIDAAKEER